jgi:hypothetical protein
MAVAESEGITIKFTGPTIFAGLLSAVIAGGVTLALTFLPDTMALLASVKRGVEHVAWAAVLPMFFYFRNLFAKAKVEKRGGVPGPVESSRYRFWRYAFLTAFFLIAVVEILKILMTVFAGAFVTGLTDAGFLQRGLLDNAPSLQRLNETLIQTQAIVILPVMVLCALVVGWMAHGLTLRRPMYYLLALTLVLFGFRLIEFAAGMALESPGVLTISKTTAGVVGFFFMLPILLFVTALLAFGVRYLIEKLISLFTGGGTGPAQGSAQVPA